MESFDEAAAGLVAFLTRNDRPAELVWIGADDVIEFAGRKWVRVKPEQSDAEARRQYATARAAGRALAVDVRGHSTERSFAMVDVAEDHVDAACRLMSAEYVKLSIPETAIPIREVHSGAAWAVLRLMANR